MMRITYFVMFAIFLSECKGLSIIKHNYKTPKVLEAIYNELNKVSDQYNYNKGQDSGKRDNVLQITGFRRMLAENNSSPSIAPTEFPTATPSLVPSTLPTPAPSMSPSIVPSVVPTTMPTLSGAPTTLPSLVPSTLPTPAPSMSPSIAPSAVPTTMPTLSGAPTTMPSLVPSTLPTPAPSMSPSIAPSAVPTTMPTLSDAPTTMPSLVPSLMPTDLPSQEPTMSFAPSQSPSTNPTTSPTHSQVPSLEPTPVPSIAPSRSPSIAPSTIPSLSPSIVPSLNPTVSPSKTPSLAPTTLPTIHPTLAPTMMPTLSPSAVPSFRPIFSPTYNPVASTSGVTFTCPEYIVSNTMSATVNYAYCSFTACGGAALILSGCNECNGNQYLSLYYGLVDESTYLITSNDDYCSSCAQIVYTISGPPSTCYNYTIHEGCLGDSLCSGNVTVYGSHSGLVAAGIVSSLSPTQLPTVLPTTAPVVPAPTVPTFQCPSYSTSNTNSATQNYATCSFTGCGGSVLTLSSCDNCNGDQYLALSLNNTVVAHSNDACDLCSQIIYTIPGYPQQCNNYTLLEGCYQDNLCGGVVTVNGASSTVLSSTRAGGDTSGEDFYYYFTPDVEKNVSVTGYLQYAYYDSNDCTVGTTAYISGLQTDTCVQNSPDGTGSYKIQFNDGNCSHNRILFFTDSNCTTYSTWYPYTSSTDCTSLSSVENGLTSSMKMSCVVGEPKIDTNSTIYSYFTSNDTSCSDLPYLFEAITANECVSTDLLSTSDDDSQLYPNQYSTCDSTAGMTTTYAYSNPDVCIQSTVYYQTESVSTPLGCYPIYEDYSSISVEEEEAVSHTMHTDTIPAQLQAQDKEQQSVVQSTKRHLRTSQSDVHVATQDINVLNSGNTTTFSCPAYTAANSASASQNYAYCTFTACGGTTLVISGCGLCTADQYLKLVNSTGLTVGQNDDSCGSCSQIVYNVTGTANMCSNYTVQEGCYEAKSCGGTVTVTGSSSGLVRAGTFGTYAPTQLPTVAPSVSPTTFINSEVPSVSPSALPTSTPSGMPTAATLSGYVKVSCSFTAAVQSIPSQMPTHNPSRVPTVYPTFGIPTLTPTVEGQTTAPSVRNIVIFSAVQVINGISYSTYLSNTANFDLTIKSAIAATMTSMSVQNVVNFTVSATTRRLSPYAIVGGSSISTAYTVNVNNAGITYDTLITQLSSAITSGLFNTYLGGYATQYNATALIGATSSSVTTVDETVYASGASGDSDDGLSEGAIAGIAVGTFVGISCIIGIAICYCYCTGDDHGEEISTPSGRVKDKKKRDRHPKSPASTSAEQKAKTLLQTNPMKRDTSGRYETPKKNEPQWEDFEKNSSNKNKETSGRKSPKRPKSSRDFSTTERDAIDL